MDADIGQRAVIERAQFVIGALPPPPIRERGPARDE
jgi:hypothetical protein